MEVLALSVAELGPPSLLYAEQEVQEVLLLKKNCEKAAERLVEGQELAEAAEVAEKVLMVPLVEEERWLLAVRECSPQ